ncbi:MAG: bifunctional 2-polyprenyl-6-hydroxyphenol methylase/3-demethylubiquinol 3-O-methyltransferase UbiG [Pseudomonadota bacterium]
MKRNDLTIYDTHAETWWAGETRWLRVLANMVPARLRHFERETEGWSGCSVLDLGCAGGFLAEALAHQGATVTGIDPAAKTIDTARAHAAAEGLSIQYDVGVGEALPYPDDNFDYVVCVDVLEHVESVPKTLSEIARVLKPGGVFCFDTINRNALARFVVITGAEDILGLLPKGTHDPALFIKPAELEAMLRETGFDPRPMRGLGPTGINRRLDFTFGITPFTGIVYIGTALLTADSSTQAAA